MRHPRPVEFHPEAVAEARAARLWYSERSTVAAEAFLAELDEAIRQASESPTRWSRYEAGTRRLLFRRFPFMLVYRSFGQADAVQVVAVAHARRKPGYWKSR